MPRKDKFEYNLVAALLIMNQSNFFPLEKTIGEDGRELCIEFEVSKAKSKRSPEEECILKEAIEILSNESKEILFIITFMPEALDKEILTPKRKMFSQKKFLRYIEKRGFKVDRVMRELRDFCETYFELKK